MCQVCYCNDKKKGGGDIRIYFLYAFAEGPRKIRNSKLFFLERVGMEHLEDG